jgi:glycolate oxidase FAD binding subunit
MVAAGLSGPARASVGALRDFVMGVTLLNGRGELLQFGGQVMKNVAGYDVSRLLAGSWGVLGVFCEVSLKVVPVARATATLCFDVTSCRRCAYCGRWAAQPCRCARAPGTAGAAVRLEGAESRSVQRRRKLGGSELEPTRRRLVGFGARSGPRFFRLEASALAAGECLWRLSVPAVTAPLALAWGAIHRVGRRAALVAQRGAGAAVRAAAAGAGGHATLVRAADKSPGAFTRPSEPLMQIHRRLKQAFDPAHSSIRDASTPIFRGRDANQSERRIQARPKAKRPRRSCAKCVHCGFCNATCPTYQLLGDELDGPRGRIYLIKQVLEGAR